MFAVLEESARLYGNAPAMHQPLAGKGATTYRTYSWKEYRDSARAFGCGLHALGIGKGDFVALHSEARAEFYIADLGIMGIGSIAAALYTSLPPSEHVGPMRILQPKALIVENGKVLRGLQAAGVTAPVTILMTEEAEGAISFEHVMAEGREALASDAQLWERIQAGVLPDDPAILYMTSGATGEPKMGLVTQWALVSNVDMGPKAVPIGPDDVSLVFLPSAHIAQRVVMELLTIRCGLPVYFSEGLAKMPNEMKSLRPTFMLAPPRVWERIYASVQTEIKKRPALARKLFYTALGLGLRANRLRREGKALPVWMSRALGIADKVIFSKVRERLGGRLRIAVSGAAPLSKDLALFFEAIGMPLLEGYGLTEGGVATLNPVNAVRPGSIGKPLDGVEVKLADDGELLLRSSALFIGYYGDPEATASVLRDGWLYTGDIASIDADGYIYITGRKKELIVSSNGKKIYPARIETLFKVEPLVGQILLVGDRQPYVTALITVNTAFAETLPGMELFKGKPMKEIAAATPVIDEVDRVIRRVNEQLAGFEHIKRFRILEREFTIERGEMTPTMKVRRKQVLENYKSVVGELYLGKEEMV